MKLIDSNILIYAADPANYPEVIAIVAEPGICVSEMSRLEVLGFNGLTPDAKTYYEQLFSFITVLPIDRAVIDKAIEIRQMQKKTKVGDAIIAATALLMGLRLVTANVKDFVHLTEISIDNPIAAKA